MKRPSISILARGRNGTLYTGVTADIARRAWAHRIDAIEGFSKRYGVHRLVYAEKTHRLAVNSPRRDLKIFTLAEGGAEHCQIDNVANYRDVMVNWTAEVLGALRL